MIILLSGLQAGCWFIFHTRPCGKIEKYYICSSHNLVKQNAALHVYYGLFTCICVHHFTSTSFTVSSPQSRSTDEMWDCWESKRYRSGCFNVTRILGFSNVWWTDGIHRSLRSDSWTLLWRAAQTLRWGSWSSRLCMKAVLQINMVSLEATFIVKLFIHEQPFRMLMWL